MSWPSSSPASRCDHLVVAAPDVEPLVRCSEEPQPAAARVAEQVEQVERGLVGDVRAELGVVGDVEEPPEVGVEPSRDVVREPLGDRDVIELDAARLVVVVERGVTGLRQIQFQLRIDGAEVGDRLADRVAGAVEVEDVAGPRLLSGYHVGEGEAELSHQAAHRDVVAVDQLAAVLGDLTVGEGAPDGPDPPAEAVVRLVDHRTVPCLLQAVRADQAGEPAADHHDRLVALRRVGAPAAQCRPGRSRGDGRSGALEDLPAATGPLEPAVRPRAARGPLRPRPAPAAGFPEGAFAPRLSSFARLDPMSCQLRLTWHRVSAGMTDFSGLSIRGRVATPSDSDWDEARQAWNLAADQQPSAVALVESADDVSKVVGFARGERPQGRGAGDRPRRRRPRVAGRHDPDQDRAHARRRHRGREGAGRGRRLCRGRRRGGDQGGHWRRCPAPPRTSGSPATRSAAASAGSGASTGGPATGSARSRW